MSDLQMALAEATDVLLKQVARDKHQSRYWQERNGGQALDIVESWLSSVAEWALANDDLAKVPYPEEQSAEKKSNIVALGTVRIDKRVMLANMMIGNAHIYLVVRRHNADVAGNTVVQNLVTKNEWVLSPLTEVIIQD